MKIKFLDLNKQYLSIKSELDQQLLSEINRCEFINGQAKTNFEHNFAQFIGTQYCLGVANGTDALEIAIKSLNLPENSEVIIPANTFIATCLGATYNRLKIVFADVNYDTMMLDLEDLERIITPQTRLVVVVHLYGQSCPMDRLVEICQKHRLYLIEDCAQSHGAYYRDQKLGTFGDLSCFSFYPGKNLGAYGDGGAICTNHQEYYNFIKKYSNLGSIVKYQHELVGRNSRLDTIQATVLNIKLKYLDQWNQSRREKALLYHQLLSDCPHIELNQIDDGCLPVYHLFVIKVKNNRREELMNYLKQKGVDTIIHYPIPCHKTRTYQEYNHQVLTNVETLAGQILSLPIYAEITEEEITYICYQIKQFFAN